MRRAHATALAARAVLALPALAAALALGASSIAAAPALGAPSIAAARSRPLPGAPVPRGFVGVNLDGPMSVPGNLVPLAPQFRLMGSSGVQSVRVTFSWALAQPYASWADVPAGQRSRFVSGAGGVPTGFALTDQVVQLAAARGMTVLPVVMFTPPWDAGATAANSLTVPRRDAPYAAYLTTLVRRYGPRGSFWRQHPRLPRRPIRMWEVWNEPWLSYYWPLQPFEHSYLQLLRASRAAIKHADRGAKVVLGGMPNASWIVLQSIYRIHGARGLFDAVDIHPYTRYPQGVITILRLVRQTMRRYGDAHKPIIVGETGWTSSLHRTRHLYDWEATPAGQASKAARLLALLAADRRPLGLLDFYWYTWMGDESSLSSPFNFSGLVGYHDGGRVVIKPVLLAFRREAQAIER